MTASEATANVNRIIAELMQCSRDEVTPDAHLVDALGMDSLDLIELALFVEEEIGVEVFDEDMESLATVADVHALVLQRLGLGEAA